MVVAIAGLSVSAHAQRSCELVADSSRAATPWTAPLDTRVTLRAKDLPLRDALERVSALSGVQLAYASDLLPLDRRTCVEAAGAPVGGVLTMLLAGSGVEPKVVAGRVVLAPRGGDASPEAEMARQVGTLERVLVTGSAVASARRPLAIGVEVVDGERLRRESRSTLSQILNAAAPGIWLWERSASSLVAQYAGIRGTSSFSSSYPKIYIDGVEVANPLLVTQFDPDVIDRVEVIRGPQGSALYGSDAISGVINVVTRHDGRDAASAGVHISSSAGAGATSFGAGPVPTHEQRVAVRGGSNVRSGGLALDFGQTGAVTPSSESRHLLASGDARVVGSQATITATGRYVDKRAVAGTNPLLASFASNPAQSGMATDAQPQVVRQYTLGTSATVATDGRWTHSALVGIDGYHLDHVANVTGPFIVGIDSALRAAQGSGDRMTLRASTVGELGDDATLPMRLTIGVERDVLRQIRAPDALASTIEKNSLPAREEVESWNHDIGVFSQLNVEWDSRVYLTGGVRVERNDAFSGPNRLPVLPLLGAAVVRDLGAVQLKLRSAYGKGIRPPQTPARVVSATQQRQRTFLTPALDPELQSGIETGAELYVGRVLSVQATRFDQLASGLIQNVAVGVEPVVRGTTTTQRVRYQLQNVGEIGNHGWEMQATARFGAAAVVSTFTTVDSRVRRLASGYNGDLRVGDRMLGLPARTGSLDASWTDARWFVSLSGTRAWDWIDYDRFALARAFMTSTSTTSRNLVGPRLRAYWMQYPGDTHLRLATTFRVRPAFGLTFTGENLLGGQLGEPDDVTIRPGRTITGGLRASF